MIDLAYLGIELCELGNRGFRRAYINAPNEFFINSESQQIARYPKSGIIGYEKNDIIDGGSKVKDCEFDCRLPQYSKCYNKMSGMDFFLLFVHTNIMLVQSSLLSFQQNHA